MFGSTWGQNNNQQQQAGGGLFGGGGGGFGQQQQQQQQQNTGFGQQQNTGFGQQPNTAGGGLFGTSSSTGSGFGGGSFGQNTAQQNSSFGARPTFGATGTASFGGANAGGGLFGSSNNATSGFGASNASTSGGLFGAKPATSFGASPSAGGLFGAKPTTSGFGQPATNVQFGVPSPQVMQYQNTPPPPVPSTGTQAPIYQPTWQRDPTPAGIGKDPPAPHLFNVINAMNEYRGASFEELRMLDYQQGRKEPTPQAQAQQVGVGGFGQPAAAGFGTQPGATSTFGQTAPKPGSLFGGSGTAGFGSTSAGFGQTNPGTAGGLFGQSNPTAGGFGQTSTGTTGGLFGQNNQQQQTATTGGLFGNPNPFGQNQQQQQQQQPSAGFGFGSAAANKPFGSAGTTTPFGAGAGSTFGQTNTATPAATGFGGFGQTAPQQQQQPAAGGLFGNTTGGFGQTAQQPATGGTSLFGNTGQAPAAGGGLFSGATAPKPGGLFGSGATGTTGTTGFGGFGQTTATPAQPATGGLFGNTANTGATGGGLFGNTGQQQPGATTGGLFGNTTNSAATGAGLFGASKPATGGLFGNTGATNTGAVGASGFGGFGTQTAGVGATGGGLFGAGTAQTAPKPAGGLFGGGSSLFGAQANTATAQPATGGLFGGGLGQSQTATTGGIFGSATMTATQPTATSGLFGSALGQSTAQQPQPSLTASVDQSPYGQNSLFAYSGQKLELGNSTKKPALPPLSASTFRVTPTKGRVTKLRGFANSLSASQSSNGRGSSPALNSSRGSLVGTPVPSERYKGLTDTALSPNAFIPRPNIKKLTVALKTNNHLNGADDPLESVFGKSTLRSPANGTPSTPETIGRSPVMQPVSAPRADDTPTRRSASASLDTSLRVPVSERPLKRGDYWCRPRIDKLRLMSHDELSKLENFSAGRKGYGEVTFLEPVDLTTLPSLHGLLGHIIVVEDLELSVYPDEKNKPARGKGLNVPAQISLENCFARDKATRQPITDPSDPRYQRQLKRVKVVPETEFISFSSEGVWTFNVAHFSRYGLRGDSDGDDSDDGDRSATPPAKSASFSGGESEDDDFLPPTKSLHDNVMMDEEHTSSIESSETEGSYDDDSMEDDEYDDEIVDEPNWGRPLKAKLGMDGMRKLREMQSSFFGSTDVKPPQPTPAQAKQAQALAAARAMERKRAESGFGEAEEGDAGLGARAASRASFGESSCPPQLRQPRKYAKVPLADSTVAGNEGIRPDAGLALGRSFRCSWGPNGELVHFGKICAPGTKFASSPDAVVFVEQVDLLAEPADVERPRAERLLRLLLENTKVEAMDQVPAAFIDTSIRFNNFAALFEDGDRSHEANLWRLGNALFDEIDLGLPETTSVEVAHRIGQVRRKLALSKWLEDAVAPAVDLDLIKVGDNRPAQAFMHLTGNKIDHAVQATLDGKDMRLAMLVSQAGGPEVFRAEVALQLDEWTQFKANSLINYDYRKLYALLAGITDVSLGDVSRGADASPDVFVAENLDWKRAFGLHFWYGCMFEDTISDVLASYQHALASPYPPAQPLPPYLEKPEGGEGWSLPTEPTDILFNLIRMYSDITVPLDEVLGARDCSPSPTDFRLPWHLYLLLSRALQKRDFADRDEPDEEDMGYSSTADRLTSSYAAQLEEEGQWTWALYVLLYLEHAENRRVAIQALLFRHPNPSTVELDLLTRKLRIPKTWLEEARAAQLAAAGDAFGEYFALINAGLVDRAQRTLVGKLAPEALLRSDHALLRRLCEALEPHKPTGWEYRGKLFLDFLDLVQQVPRLLEAVLRAGSNPDPHEASQLSELAQNLPRVLQLLPALFPDRDQGDVQQVATLNGMLSELQTLAAHLHAANYIARPPVSDLLVDKDRLHLLQGAATESFERSLAALTAA